MAIPDPSTSEHDAATSDWPGQRLGRPAAGPGSVARFPRRLIALVLDWYLCFGICWLIVGTVQGWAGIWPLVAFLVYQSLLVGMWGHTLGHLLCGMQVQTLRGTPAGFGRAALRALLVTLVIPAVVMDEDQRGLQDRLNDTVLVRIR
ncbi:RDD family protein [Rothia kristinae]|uniref:RDD family protein n=1 Tax=Rothia kristinae TaxID=37923 RepID=A0A7T4T4Z5_9MICC|nr:RDD family protein [Rothia kristinae]MDN5640285.1 RDD family protein [Actinomycetes bacterium]QQC59780.1 RDD family protein [Rothia kristinae]